MQKNIFESEYNKLNENQKKAVDSIYGPVMIVAGPGTWKTQIIGLRTANIILKTWTNPENILITTFTDAWVVAIKKRLETFLGSEWYKVYVSTIHSFCQDVIKTFPEKFLHYKAWILIDEVDSIELLKNILDEEISKKNIEVLTNDYDKYIYLKDIKNCIQTLKQEWVSFLEFENIILQQEKKYVEELSEIKPTLKKFKKVKLNQEKHIKKLKELNYLYKIYQNRLFLEEKYDFSDMINFVVSVFEIDEELRYHYAEKFQFIMLDEFQDTNNAQNKIIDLILSVWEEQPNILVVWDDDQSIYRFQWANIENMLDFSFKYKDTKVIVLENNYRSTQPILDLCSALIENNAERLTKKISWLQKKLISNNMKLKNIYIKPTLALLNTKDEEKVYLLNEVKQKLQNWIKPEEIAIIVRNNKEVEELSIFFTQNNISVVSKLNTDILKNDYVNFILKYLNCLDNPFTNNEYFIDIVRSSIVWLNQIDIFKFNKDLYNKNYSRKIPLSFYDEFCQIEKSKIDFLDKKNLIAFRDNFEDLRQKLNNTNFLEFFSYFIDKIWVIPYIEKYGNFDDIQDIFSLFNKIKSFLEINPSLKLKDILTKFDLYKIYNYSIPRQILKKPKSWINILTAHGSKWLEYEIVYIPGLYSWNWDWKKISDKLKLPIWIVWIWLQWESQPIEEERRLFFVACSRAKKELHFSFPSQIDNKLKLQSVFLAEVSPYFENIEIKIEDNLFKRFVINELVNNKLLNYSKAEFDYIEEFLQNYKLSPTDLNVFLENPMIFLQNVVFKYPFVDNDATIFWKIYHRVLELFYLKYKENKVLPKVSYLTSTFELLLKKEILSPKSYEKLLEKWIIWLKGFYEIYKNNIREIVALEYNFRSKWLQFENIPLTWKIDKIEIIMQPQTVALVDYKTGKPKSLAEIKWLDNNWNKKPNEWKYFRQLLFYKLLCELDNEFNSKYDIWSLALDFVEGKEGEYKYIEIPYTMEEYEDFKKELLDAWKKISNIEFWKEILK